MQYDQKSNYTLCYKINYHFTVNHSIKSKKKKKTYKANKNTKFYLELATALFFII